MHVLIIQVTPFHLVVSASHSFLGQVVHKILFIFRIVILLIGLVFFLEVLMVVGFDVVEVSF